MMLPIFFSGDRTGTALVFDAPIQHRHWWNDLSLIRYSFLVTPVLFWLQERAGGFESYTTCLKIYRYHGRSAGHFSPVVPEVCRGFQRVIHFNVNLTFFKSRWSLVPIAFGFASWSFRHSGCFQILSLEERIKWNRGCSDRWMHNCAKTID